MHLPLFLLFSPVCVDLFVTTVLYMKDLLLEVNT